MRRADAVDNENDYQLWTRRPMSERSPVLSPFWRNQLRQWHWISSALCLIALLLFSVTGFTLNHAAQISARPKTTHVEKDLPATDAALIAQAKDGQPLPAGLRAAVKALTGVAAGPLGMSPKYFAISLFAVARSMSPASATIALLGP